MILLVTAVVVGCDGRALPSLDDAGTTLDGPHTPPPPDGASPNSGKIGRDAAVTSPTCTQLYLVKKVTLGTVPGSTTSGPAVAHDGKGHFGVVWNQHGLGSGSDPDSGPTLRFCRVSESGKAVNPEGVKLAPSKALPLQQQLQPQLQHDGKEYLLLYNAAAGGATLARFDDQGAIHFKGSGIGTLTHAAMAPHPQGDTVLYVNPYVTELHLARFSQSGLFDKKLVHKGEPYWNLWLAARPSGFAAAWGKRFARLGQTGLLQGQPKTAIKKDYISVSSWVARDDGTYAVAYVRASDLRIEILTLDASGTALGPPVPVEPAGVSSAPIKQISLLWTGRRFILVNPSKDGAIRARLLDAQGKSLGQPVKLPQCLSWSMLAGAAAWGGNRLAVATVDGLSGPPWGVICVSILGCK
jgi:hypothetical protein